MNIEKETQSIKIYSGKTVNSVKHGGASKACLTRAELATLHLMPTQDPVAFEYIDNGTLKFYFSPDNVTVTPAELWYPENENEELSITLSDGSAIPLVDSDSAESMGYYTREHLESLHLAVVEAPVAYMHKPDSDENEKYEYLYDMRTCMRQALQCVRCGKEDRFRNKLCRKCYEKDMLKRRKQGDAYRQSVTGVDRGKAIFFDLELTGVYPYDEIISVSITDGWGNEIMDTIVRPEKRRQWNQTVKIHGITPKMTQYAPYLSEITPKIKRIFLDSEIIVAYGIATDYAHIKEIFTESEREQLIPKLRDCAKEYVRYISEYEPDINKSSLVSATEYFGIEWSGTAHTSMADTHACRILWEKLFPCCYINEASEGSESTEIIGAINAMPKTLSVTFDEALELSKKDKTDEKSKSCQKKKDNCTRKKSSHGKGQGQPQKKGIETQSNIAPVAPATEQKPSEKKKSIVDFFKKFVKN